MAAKFLMERSRRPALAIIGLLILFQMVRIVVFVNDYGSVEHDGGWALGVARSLAEHGIYASLTSTMIEPEARTGYNIYNQFTVQDEQGREYFFVANTMGVGTVLPNALVFWLFGFGFWQSRLAGLFFFLLFLVLASGLLYYIQGLLSVLVFHCYLFFFPQIYIFLGYEALGEMPSMVYILLSFVLFVRAVQPDKQHWGWFFGSGVLAALAINTRLTSLIVYSGFFVVWGIMVWQKKISVQDALIVLAGVLSIAALWQVVMFLGLAAASDAAAYFYHLASRIEFFIRSVEGITPVAEGFELIRLKALILSEYSYASLPMSLLLGLVTAAGGALLIRHYWVEEPRRNLLILLWLAWLVYTVWFLNGPKNAWVRYYWYGSIWMIMLLALMFGVSVQKARGRPNLANISACLLLVGLFVFSFSRQPQAVSLFITPDLIEHWRQRQLETADTYLPWFIASRAEQETVAKFVRDLPAEVTIYYPEGHTTAEMSFLTNRVFYPLERRALAGTKPTDLVIIGPALTSTWKKDQQQRLDVLQQVRRECPDVVFETPHYILCRE